jgi:hypothetical protein
MPPTTIHFSDSRQALASCGNVFVTVLREPMTIEAVEPLKRESSKMSQRCGGKCVSLAIIEPTAATAASTEVREATAAFARDSNILAAAIVIEGSGFRPAATRTLVAGMYLVTKKSYPHKIVATPEEGAVWLVEQLAASGVNASASDIVAAAVTTRAAIR